MLGSAPLGPIGDPGDPPDAAAAVAASPAPDRAKGGDARALGAGRNLRTDGAVAGIGIGGSTLEQHPFIETLLRSGPVGQSILAGLLLLSVYTWATILTKTVALRKARASTAELLAAFRESGTTWLKQPPPATLLAGPMGQVCHAGLREFRAQMGLLGPGQRPGEDAITRIEAAMEAETVDQIAELEKGHLILAIAASASPFIGLFGTVWGIMNAFRGMGLEGSAGIAAVAPGVAEALVTTVAGLAVAIPAVVAYNLLNRRVQLITARLDRFSTEFVRAVHHVVRTGAVAGQEAAGRGGETSAVFARRNG